MESLNSTKGPRTALWVLIAVWLVTAWYARHEFLPYDVNNTDVGTYLFQAQTFADGKLWRSTPEPRDFFQQWQVIVHDRSYAYYPPGHALFLTAPSALGFDPWLVPWLTSGLCFWLVYMWGIRFLGSVPAIFAACFMALSPMFAANAPSLLSHSSALCLTLFFLWAVAGWRERGDVLFAFVTGIMLASVFATRSLNAVALGIVWIPWVFWMRKSVWRKELRSWSAFLGGTVLITAPLFIYYRILGGRWCLELFTDHWPRNRFGFGHGLGRGEPGHYFQTYTDHDWKGMLANWHYSFCKLAEWWTGNLWFSAFLGLIIFGLVILKFLSFRKHSSSFNFQLSVFNLVPLIAWPLLHIFLYSLYYTPSTAFSGPRYLTEILPVLVLGGGWILARLDSVRFGRWFCLMGMAGMLFFSVNFKNHFYLQNARGIAARRQVEECVLHGVRMPALVFLRSFWLGHPYPIFLNRPGLSDPILYACDRGAEDKRLVALYPHRNAYILAVTPPGKNTSVQTRLIQIYDAGTQRWLVEPDRVSAPFFIGSKFLAPLELRGENVRRLFHPKPGEIEPQ